MGSSYSPDGRMLHELAARNRLPHHCMDLEEDETAEMLLHQLDVTPEETPVVIWGGQVLGNPSNQELARAKEFEAMSVYYAATLMKVRLCRGDPVAVVGGGNSAGQAAPFLAKHTPKVHLLIRHGHLGRNMSCHLADWIERSPGVEVFLHTEVGELIGEKTLEALIVQDNQTGERHRLEARDLFVFIGSEPYTWWVGDQLALDDRGFSLTGRDAVCSESDGARSEGGREPYLFETSRPGVFAARDVGSGSIKRVAQAVGEGSMAVRSCTRGSKVAGIWSRPLAICITRSRTSRHR